MKYVREEEKKGAEKQGDRWEAGIGRWEEKP